jgi:hypothetical protein
MTLLSSIGAVDRAPIDEWLAEQADLSAVEALQRHDGECSTDRLATAT